MDYMLGLPCQDLFEEDDVLMFKDGATADDIAQGAIGNCWIIAAIAAMAGEVEKLFVTKRYEAEHAVHIELYDRSERRWKTTVVDDLFPITDEGDPAYARPTTPGEAWVLFLEKAFAQLFGNYQDLVQKHPFIALEILTGCREIDVLVKAPPGAQNGPPVFCAYRPIEKPAWNGDDRLSQLFLAESGREGAPVQQVQLGKDDIWQLLKGATAEVEAGGGELVCCCTDLYQKDNPDRDWQGLEEGHVYTLSRVHEIELGRRQRPLWLLLLRNPHGSGEWQGEFSDRDLKARYPEVRNEIERRTGSAHRNNDDGSFYMSMEDFMNYFCCITICNKTSKKHRVPLGCESDPPHLQLSPVPKDTVERWNHTLSEQRARAQRSSSGGSFGPHKSWRDHASAGSTSASSSSSRGYGQPPGKGVPGGRGCGTRLPPINARASSSSGSSSSEGDDGGGKEGTSADTGSREQWRKAPLALLSGFGTAAGGSGAWNAHSSSSSTGGGYGADGNFPSMGTGLQPHAPVGYLQQGHMGQAAAGVYGALHAGQQQQQQQGLASSGTWSQSLGPAHRYGPYQSNWPQHQHQLLGLGSLDMNNQQQQQHQQQQQQQEEGAPAVAGVVQQEQEQEGPQQQPEAGSRHKSSSSSSHVADDLASLTVVDSAYTSVWRMESSVRPYSQYSNLNPRKLIKANFRRTMVRKVPMGQSLAYLAKRFCLEQHLPLLLDLNPQVQDAHADLRRSRTEYVLLPDKELVKVLQSYPGKQCRARRLVFTSNDAAAPSLETEEELRQRMRREKPPAKLPLGGLEYWGCEDAAHADRQLFLYVMF